MVLALRITKTDECCSALGERSERWPKWRKKVRRDAAFLARPRLPQLPAQLAQQPALVLRAIEARRRPRLNLRLALKARMPRPKSRRASWTNTTSSAQAARPERSAFSACHRCAS